MSLQQDCARRKGGLDENPTLKAALRYARRGWAVLPIWWIDRGGRCGCPDGRECRHPGKHPIASLVPHGVNDATTDAKTIRRWFSKVPEAFIAIATGQSGLAAIDIDLHGDCDGFDEIDKVIERYGKLPIEETRGATTPSGGGHLYYTVPSGTKIASRRLAPGIDLKADGGYVIAPPSGDREWIRGPIMPLPTSWLRALESDPRVRVDDWARQITHRFGGKWRGTYGMIRCFAHDDHDPSLRVEMQNGVPLVHCKAGCLQEIVVAEFKQRGLWPMTAAESPELIKQSLSEFMAAPLPKTEYVIAPWLQVGGQAMLFSWTGLGKTWLAIKIGLHVAAGKPVLGWKITTPHKVLYVNAEMPDREFRDRVKLVRKTIGYDGDNFEIVTGGAQPGYQMPDLATEAGQAAIEQLLDPDTGLVIIDTVSELMRNAAENANDDWRRMVQPWLNQLRHRGVAVLLLHHESKSGSQSGASARERALDAEMQLLKAQDVRLSASVSNIELHFRKHRGFYGADTFPIAIRFWKAKDREKFRYRKIYPTKEDGILDLHHKGMLNVDIAEKLEVSKAYVTQKLQENGLERNRKEN